MNSKITKSINGMRELKNLAEKHNIGEALLHQSNLQKIYYLIGKGRRIMFTEQNIDKEFTLKQKWQKIIDFLYKEFRIKEEILMDEKSKLWKNEEKAEENKRKAFNIANEPSLTVVKYVLCSETDHLINVTKKGNPLSTTLHVPDLQNCNLEVYIEVYIYI